MTQHVLYGVIDRGDGPSFVATKRMAIIGLAVRAQRLRWWERVLSFLGLWTGTRFPWRILAIEIAGRNVLMSVGDHGIPSEAFDAARFRPPFPLLVVDPGQTVRVRVTSDNARQPFQAVFTCVEVG